MVARQDEVRGGVVAEVEGLLKTDDLVGQLEMVAIADTKPHPRNDGWHPPEEIEQLRASIRTHGIDKNIILAQDGTVIAGHGLRRAALDEGQTHMPAVRKPYGPEHPLALARLVNDNHIGRMRVQDEGVLAGLLKTIRGDDPVALFGTGVSEEGFQALVERLEAKEAPAAKGVRGSRTRGGARGRWRVIVDCDTAESQGGLVERLSGQGYTCWATKE